LYILGIESSCDETAVAVIERGEANAVRSEAIKSQVELHAPYGGIVPEIAARTHYEAIDLLCRQALQQAGLNIGDIELLAVTLGPGLVGSLLIGLAFAKGLAMAHDLPLVAVDHIAAHVEAPFISHSHIDYPLLALVVSGVTPRFSTRRAGSAAAWSPKPAMMRPARSWTRSPSTSAWAIPAGRCWTPCTRKATRAVSAFPGRA
jgi:glycoprotease/Kae1 family metallohydrolase